MKSTHIFLAIAIYFTLFGCGPANEYAGHYTGVGTQQDAPTAKGVVNVKLDVERNGDYVLTVQGEGRTISQEAGSLRGKMLLPKGKVWMSKVKSIDAVPGGLGYTLRSANEEFQANLGPKKA